MKKIKQVRPYYNWGGRFLNNSYHIEGERINLDEIKKTPLRTDIINYLLKFLDRDTTYLEIGVRNPSDNFDKIKSKIKYSVDPGIEFKENPVDFKLPSDVFFEQLNSGNILSKDLMFDVIFIDGLHLADQVDRDIQNALKYIKTDGFIILHDCNPPTEWHAREDFYYDLSPARNYWNGTTWKAFLKWSQNNELFSCCIDTDWGVGIISKTQDMGKSKIIKNPFFEFAVFSENRVDSINLMSFQKLKELLNK